MPSRRGDPSRLPALLPLPAAGEGPEKPLAFLLMLRSWKPLLSTPLDAFQKTRYHFRLLLRLNEYLHAARDPRP
jgi:hypothetical protein